MHDLQILPSKAFDDALVGHQLKFLDGNGMRVVEHDGRVGQLQGIAVMVDEDLAEAAVGVQLEHGNQMLLGELLAQGFHAGVDLGWCMGEVAEDEVVAVVEQQLQTPCGTLKRRDSLIELRVAHAELLAHQLCCVDVLHVVAAKHAHFPPTAIGQEQGRPDAVALKEMHAIAESAALRALGNLLGFHIGLVVDKAAARLDGADEDAELLQVVVEGREDIDMVPADAADDSDMWVIVVELRHTVDGRSEVFVAFHDHVFRRLAEAHHHVKAFQLRPDHEVGLDADLLEHMEDHGGDGRLAVAAADNDAGLVLALFVEVFGIGIHLEAQLLGAHQLGVVDAGVHAEDDGIVGDLSSFSGYQPHCEGRMPSLARRDLDGSKISSSEPVT